MGYSGATRCGCMITGEITSLQPTFPAAGSRRWRSAGSNILHRFRSEQALGRLRKHDRQPDRQGRSASRLRHHSADRPDAEAAEEQLRVPAPGQPVRHRLPAGAGPPDRLRPARRGATRTASALLHFGPSSPSGRPPTSSSYGRSLIEFQPDLTTANQVGKVTVRRLGHRSTRSRSSTRATRSDLRTQGRRRRRRSGAIEQSFQPDARRSSPTSPVETPGGGDARSRPRLLERIAKDMVTATGSTVGLPDLRAGTVLEIDGLGSASAAATS